MPIVVGVDGSPLSERVVTKAIAEAERRNEELHVVHVYQPPLMYFPTTLAEPVDFAETHRAHVWERLTPILEMSRVDWQRVDLTGYPGDVLVDYIANVDASLVILGTRGHGDFKSLLLGSTSHRVAQLATCDVLIIKT